MASIGSKPFLKISKEALLKTSVYQKRNKFKQMKFYDFPKDPGESENKYSVHVKYFPP